jgi:hypothetical protein
MVRQKYLEGCLRRLQGASEMGLSLGQEMEESNEDYQIKKIRNIRY